MEEVVVRGHQVGLVFIPVDVTARPVKESFGGVHNDDDDMSKVHPIFAENQVLRSMKGDKSPHYSARHMIMMK